MHMIDERMTVAPRGMNRIHELYGNMYVLILIYKYTYMHIYVCVYIYVYYSIQISLISVYIDVYTCSSLGGTCGYGYGW
jgi:hypothetical protein